jgi:peptidoglycan/LPS O-acetylase OafA/YrhL
MASQANSPHDPEEKRLVFIDALRVAAIVFVIIHHAAQAYGPTGAFGPCMIARKAAGSLRSIPQMRRLAWD